MTTKNILVFGEVEKGRLAPITKELLGGARRLSDQVGAGVNLLVAGALSGESLQDAAEFGTDIIYHATDPGYGEFSSDAYSFLAVELCKKIDPVLCLMGQTDLGRDIAPRIAARLGAGLCMDCVEVRFDPAQNIFVQTRPAFGGKALAEFSSPAGKLQVNTIRAKSMEPAATQAGRKSELMEIKEGPDPSAIKTKLVSVKVLETDGIKLEEAKIIVAGGGGLGSAEGFTIIKELADALGGVIGATRVPVDENWVPLSIEIGQTGKIVSPDLYIAIGISGAAQHITGMVSSKKIVAINKDPDANIFKISDLGLVADYKTVVPVLIEKIKESAR
ncbi:MAG: electron transfer flavoprotein subunit alpha/FixB family protein [Syntrophales bacterium]|jgi:electron transfer flavoprotein alpha subunit|nr:electron transfer flavoprotein subunit alpha/FixB family protein [Syntrophales bacterium]MCK9392346.1 electron transfer flavoprotein subunit alpha/FixB family protein [Syntrophales bacterium]